MRELRSIARSCGHHARPFTGQCAITPRSDSPSQSGTTLATSRTGLRGELHMEEKRVSRKLGRDHPTGIVFLDETGAIANDRFFGVGLVHCSIPSRMLRAVQKLRDETHWYQEFKFSDVTRDALPLYKRLVDAVLVDGELSFFCFIADKQIADPIERFGDQWTAYAKMAEQLIVASLKHPEIISVLADNYSTPATVLFEEDLRASINRRLHRLAVTTVTRLDSRSSDGLQVVDLLTSAAAFEFRAAAGVASASSPKGQLAAYVRGALGCPSMLGGWSDGGHSVAMYEHGRWAAEQVAATDPLV